MFLAAAAAIPALLEANYAILGRFKANMAQLRVTENTALLVAFRDNILAILQAMGAAGGVMAAMPPLPVWLNVELADNFLPTSSSGRANIAAAAAAAAAAAQVAPLVAPPAVPIPVAVPAAAAAAAPAPLLQARAPPALPVAAPSPLKPAPKREAPPPAPSATASAAPKLPVAAATPKAADEAAEFREEKEEENEGRATTTAATETEAAGEPAPGPSAAADAATASRPLEPPSDVVAAMASTAAVCSVGGGG